MFTFLPTLPDHPPGLRRSWAPPRRLISAIRRSLLKPGGMFQGASRSRAFRCGLPLNPWPGKTQSGSTQPQPLRRLSRQASVWATSPPTLQKNCSGGLWQFLNGLCPINVCFDADRAEGKGHTVSPPSPWHSAPSRSLARIPKLNGGWGGGGGNRGWIAPPEFYWPFSKRQLLLWPNRWHFTTLWVRLQCSQMAFERITAEKKGAELNHPKPFNNITTKHVIQGLKCNLVWPEVRFFMQWCYHFVPKPLFWNEIKITVSSVW